MYSVIAGYTVSLAMRNFEIWRNLDRNSQDRQERWSSPMDKEESASQSRRSEIGPPFWSVKPRPFDYAGTSEVTNLDA